MLCIHHQVGIKISVVNRGGFRGKREGGEKEKEGKRKSDQGRKDCRLIGINQANIRSPLFWR